MNIHPQHHYYLPAEWYPQSGIMLTWPHEHTDWKPYLQDITETYLRLAHTISLYESLLIATSHVEETKQQLKKRLSADQMSRIYLYEIDSDDTWARDHGPITLIATSPDRSHTVPQRLLNFNFNAWGKKFAYEKDNAINQQLYYAGAFNATIEDHSDFTLEGGAIESDGQGTILTTASCMLAPHRNQPLSRTEINAQLKRRLHAKRIVWLEHGHLIGDDTDGHVDTIVRFAPSDTLLYVAPGPESDPQHADFALLEQQLTELRTLKDQPYRLIALPMPQPIYDGKERLPATYANFLVINGAVIYPTYNQPENDFKAAEAISRAFPDRQLIGIDAHTIIRQHGSIHCLTMQLPQNVLHVNNTCSRWR